MSWYMPEDATTVASKDDLIAALKSAALWIEATAELYGDTEAAAKFISKLNAVIARAEGS